MARKNYELERLEAIRTLAQVYGELSQRGVALETEVKQAVDAKLLELINAI